VVTAPPAHTTGSPAAQLVNEQPCWPALASGQARTHDEPVAQVAEQFESAHAKLQALSGPQLQVPFAQVPSHAALWPAHSTWHGPAWQSKLQVAPSAHEHVPFAQVPEHDAPAWQVT
jgi:hypothetical protein